MQKISLGTLRMSLQWKEKSRLGMNTGMRLNVTTVIKVSMIKKLKKREKITRLLLRTGKKQQRNWQRYRKFMLIMRMW